MRVKFSSADQESEDPRSPLGERPEPSSLKRRLYVTILLLASCSSLVALPTNALAGATHPVTTAVLCFVVVYGVAASWAIRSEKLPFRVVEESIWMVASGLLVVVFVFGLYLAETPMQARLATVGSYLWFPVSYVVVFLTNETRGALTRSLLLYVVVVLVSAPRLLEAILYGTGDTVSEVLLVQLYFSSALLISALYFFGRLSDQARNSAISAERMRHLAHTDALTDLKNRRSAERVLEKEMEYARRYATPLAVIVFDVDDFKRVNDDYGHDVGDAILVNVARTVESGLRESDSLARWGGEEFVVVAPQTSPREALALAERVMEGVRSVSFNGTGGISASFGISFFRPEDSATTLVKRADVALYKAKRSGKDRVEAEVP